MRNLRNTAAAAALALTIGTQAQAMVTFGSATLRARAYNIIGDSSYNIDREATDTQSTPAPLSVTATSNANTLLNTGPPPRPYLESGSSVAIAAAVTGPDQLEFVFTADFAQSLAPSTLLSSASSNSGGELALDFSLSTAMDFNLLQGFAAPGSLFSDVTVRQLLDGGATNDVVGRGSSGIAIPAFSALLEAGNYRLFLSNNLINVLVGTQGSSAAGAMSSRFDVSFTAPLPPPPPTVPEPASWAMLIAGFGLIGAAQRRQHRRQLR